jgi:hypothetical protein
MKRSFTVLLVVAGERVSMFYGARERPQIRLRRGRRVIVEPLDVIDEIPPPQPASDSSVPPDFDD